MEEEIFITQLPEGNVMKRLIGVILVSFIIVFLFYNIGYAQVPQNVNWNAFGKNLVKAIQSDNEGLQRSAMCMIIRYADYLSVKDARFDIVRIFRSHKNPKVRQLAMVTLYHMKDDWAMYFLKRNIKFEKDECILKQNCCIVNTYYAEKEAKKANEKEGVITISSR
jgi:hypothetical protein